MKKKKAVQIIWIVLGIQSETNTWDMQVSREFVFVIFRWNIRFSGSTLVGNRLN